jgi:cyclic pyranopterin phosphate synthase
VVIRGANEGEVEQIARFGLERGCEVRFLELMPIGCAAAGFGERFVPAAEVSRRLERSFRLEALPHRPGETARNFRASAGGLRGTVGLITPESRPFCAGCRRVRLTSTGELVACLARGTGPGVRGLLRSATPEADGELLRLLSRELACKAARPAFQTARPMAGIGG